MTATSLIQIIDRFALTAMHTVVLLGLPLVAIGMIVRSF